MASKKKTTPKKKAATKSTKKGAETKASKKAVKKASTKKVSEEPEEEEDDSYTEAESVEDDEETEYEETSSEGDEEGEDGDWFSTGSAANDRIDKEDEKQKERGNRAFRHYLPVGSSQEITFVDGLKSPHGYQVPFSFMEHNLLIGDSYKNWCTCIKGLKVKGKKQACPLCRAGNRPYLATAYTIIDHNHWVDKNGNPHENERKLFVCKTKVAKILKRAASKRGGLRGWRTEISREGDKSPNTGDSFDWSEKTKLPADCQPFDYRKEFAPLSADELRDVIGEVQSDGSDEEVRF